MVRSVRLVNPVGCRGTPRWAAPPALGVMRRRQARTHHIRSSRWMGGVEGQLDLSIPTASRVLCLSSMPRWSPPADGSVLAGHVAPASILHCSQAEAAMLAPKSAKSSSRGASAPPGEAVTTSGSWHLVNITSSVDRESKGPYGDPRRGRKGPATLSHSAYGAIRCAFSCSASAPA